MGKIDLSVIGKKTEPVVFEYTWRDVVLYALGVGATAQELSLVYEHAPGGLKVLPSFCVVPAMRAFPRCGDDIEWSLMLHGEQIIRPAAEALKVMQEVAAKSDNEPRLLRKLLEDVWNAFADSLRDAALFTKQTSVARPYGVHFGNYFMKHVRLIPDDYMDKVVPDRLLDAARRKLERQTIESAAQADAVAQKLIVLQQSLKDMEAQRNKQPPAQGAPSPKKGGGGGSNGAANRKRGGPSTPDSRAQKKRAGAGANAPPNKTPAPPQKNKQEPWRAVDLGKAKLQRPDEMKKALFYNNPRFMSLNKAMGAFRSEPGNARACFYANSPIGQVEPHCPWGTKGDGTCNRDPSGH